MCYTSALGLGRLLDDFLSLEKIEQGKLKVELGIVQVKRMVDETLRLFRPAVESKKLRLLRTAASDIPARLVGDDHKLRQCLANFVSNAIKFSPSGGQITVRLSVVYAQRLQSAVVPVPALGAISSRLPHGSTASMGAGSTRTIAVERRAHASQESMHAPPSPASPGGDAGSSVVDFIAVLEHTPPHHTAPEHTDSMRSLRHRVASTLAWLGHGLGITRVFKDGLLSAAPVSEAPSASLSVSLPTGNSPAALPPSLPEAPKEESAEPRPGLVAYLKISVEDQGVGISPADQAKLFQPFQQIRAGALQKGNGTGLGLAIVRQIVNLSGGYVGVQSVEGQGSTFFFCVPLDRGVPSLSGDSPSGTTEELATRSTTSHHHHNQQQEREVSMADAVASDPVVEAGAEWLLTPAAADAVAIRFGSPFCPLSDEPQGGQGVEAAAPLSSTNDRTASSGVSPVSRSTDGVASVDSVPSRTVQGAVASQDALASSSGLHARESREGLLTEANHVRDGSVRSTRASSLQDSCSLLQRAVVVDDLASNRQLLVRMLKRRGVQECWEASDGTEALTLAQELGRQGRLHDVQAWLLDEEMPVMKGSEAIRVLREQYGVKALMLSVTGNALSEDQLELKAAGADSVLPKPVQASTLNDLLQQHGLTLAGNRQAMSVA